MQVYHTCSVDEIVSELTSRGWVSLGRDVAKQNGWELAVLAPEHAYAASSGELPPPIELGEEQVTFDVIGRSYLKSPSKPYPTAPRIITSVVMLFAIMRQRDQQKSGQNTGRQVAGGQQRQGRLAQAEQDDGQYEEDDLDVSAADEDARYGKFPLGKSATTQQQGKQPFTRTNLSKLGQASKGTASGQSLQHQRIQGVQDGQIQRPAYSGGASPANSGPDDLGPRRSMQSQGQPPQIRTGGRSDSRPKTISIAPTANRFSSGFSPKPGMRPKDRLHRVLRMGWRPLVDVVCNSLTGRFLGGHDKDLYIQCTAPEYLNLPLVDVKEGGCIMTCAQFEKRAGRELSKKWKESIHVLGESEGTRATLITWLRRQAARRFGETVIGKHCWIRWCSDGEFYQAVVIGYNMDTGKHKVWLLLPVCSLNILSIYNYNYQLQVRYSESLYVEELHLPVELIFFTDDKPLLPELSAAEVAQSLSHYVAETNAEVSTLLLNFACMAKLEADHVLFCPL